MPRPADQPCQFNQLIILDISANSIHILAEQDLRPFPVLAQLNLATNGMVEVGLNLKHLQNFLALKFCKYGSNE
jgi:hypothetical protein